MKISVVIIAFNEAANIEDAIRSVEWADEVLVVDSESTDGTPELAEGAGAKVIIQPWLGFSRQKQFATDAAKNDWVFSLDADERVSPALRAEIEALEGRAHGFDGFTVPRLSKYLGRDIRHGGWYPDRQLRLFNRTKGRWSDRVVHEAFELDGAGGVGELNADLLHFSVPGPEEHAKMVATRYAPLGAAQMYRDGRTSGPIRAVASAFGTIFRGYVLKLGILDGYAGFCIAALAAQNTFLKHTILCEMRRSGKNSK